jgi:hypothetical protein
MINYGLLLEKLFRDEYEVGQTPELRNAFSNMNIAFFAQRRPDEKTFGGLHFMTSPMYNHLIRIHKLDGSEQNENIVKELRVWTSAHIRLPDGLREAIS